MIMITVILIIKVTIIKTKSMNKKNNPTANVCGNKNNNEKITKNNDTISNNNSIL